MGKAHVSVSKGRHPGGLGGMGPVIVALASRAAASRTPPQEDHVICQQESAPTPEIAQNGNGANIATAPGARQPFAERAGTQQQAIAMQPARQPSTDVTKVMATSPAPCYVA